ncbi:hypothetical protein QBC36DRAFT_60399 [Triangularia setosa]|uniref:Uncharacterized protein n=1 Tax=Triangularia setosa TaxID=2587417 RepID=A0AAN7A5I6_9PEZI|nr:hypothetical protein QBC36DRAFT_60399 [Podospora setosa]
MLISIFCENGLTCQVGWRWPRVAAVLRKQIRSIGQIMPLATIFGILAISFDTGKLTRPRTANQQGNQQTGKKWLAYCWRSL